jgi:hypothetical protein
MSKNVIRWFESPALDKPELRSPQPCKRGVHCDYKLKDEASGELVRACCSGVHPGEEGTGRRLFPARTLDDGKQQPACVRLTGASHGFYERRRLRLSWAEWCEKHGIPFTPALPGQPFEPLVRAPLGGKKPDAAIQAAMELCQPYMREQHPMQQHAAAGGSTAFGLNPRAFDVMAQQHAEQSLDPRMQSRGFLGMPGGAQAARLAAGGGGAATAKLTKNQRKRANRKARESKEDEDSKSDDEESKSDDEDDGGASPCLLAALSARLPTAGIPSRAVAPPPLPPLAPGVASIQFEEQD